MYRTINETLKLIKSLDSNSSITLYYLRSLCKSGLIQVLNVNKKYLINIHSLSQFLGMNLTEL